MTLTEADVLDWAKRIGATLTRNDLGKLIVSLPAGYPDDQAREFLDAVAVHYPGSLWSRRRPLTHPERWAERERLAEARRRVDLVRAAWSGPLGLTPYQPRYINIVRILR